MKKRTEIINEILNKYENKVYLEIGVREPSDNFNHIICDVKHGVDPSPKGSVTHKMTSDKFFSQKNDDIKYTLIFIDGLHTEEQAYKDIQNSLKVLADDGVILLHDCNPPTKKYIRSHDEYLKYGGGWCGTTFRAFIRSKYELAQTHGCFVIDVETGIGVISKNYKILTNNFNEKYLDWDYFNDNREQILHLLSHAKYKKLKNGKN